MTATVSLSDISDQYIARIDESFAAAVRATASERGRELQDMILYHYSTGGKRLRPLCVALAARMGTQLQQREQDLGAEQAAVLPFATAVEMIHNATLIHDDLQDGDQLRRGKPTLWHKYSPAQAINCGDLLFFQALQVLQAAQYEDVLHRELSDLLAATTIAVIEGQGREFTIKERISGKENLPGVDSYEEMVKGKTAALFTMPFVGGALIAGFSASELGGLRKGCDSLGLAFQIQDDLLDIWGDKGRDQAGSDIAEGKLSYPLLVTFTILEASGRGEEHNRLLEILRKEREDTVPSEVKWAVELATETGARERAAERFFALEKELSVAGEWTPALSELYSQLAAKVRQYLA